MEAKLNVLNDVLEGLGIANFGIPSLGIDESLSDENIVLVDIRTEDERNASTIKGAISKQEFEASNIDSYRDKKLVFFDTVGYLGAAYAAVLKKNGSTNVYVLGEGAFLGYVIRGHPVVKPDGSPAHTVHSFNAQLALLVDDIDNISVVYFHDAEERLLKYSEYYSGLLGITLL